MIETSRLTITPFRADDFPSFRDLVLDKEKGPMALYDAEFPISDDGIERTLAWFEGHPGEYFAVRISGSEDVIGLVTLNKIGMPNTRNLGMVFTSTWQGHGYATEACAAVIDHAFANMGLTRLVSGTADINRPARRLLARLGFTRTGTALTWFRKDEDGNPIEFMGGSYELTNGAKDVA